MKILNYTPHHLRLVGEDGAETILAPAGEAPRLTTSRELLGTFDGIPVVRTTLGAPVGLPDHQKGVVLVVSALVAEHPSVSHRTDLAYPGEALRDDAGRVIGARGLCAGPGLAAALKGGSQ